MSLRISELNVSVGKTHILHDINLEILDGEFFSFLGSSGSGKSTLLKTIAGFMQEQTGTIMMGDKPLHALPPQKRGTIIVFQDMRLFSNMTVGENVSYPLRLKGARKAERQSEAERYLQMVQLGGFSRRYVSELSGGQAQRVAIARALAAKPKVLLLDEPFSSLDENLRDDMRKLVTHIHRETGLTTVMVTHDQHEALSLSDRIAIMEGGHITQIGTPQEVYETPRTLSIAAYFADGDILEGFVENGVFVSGGLAAQVPSPRKDGPCTAVIRENSFELGSGGEKYRVESVEYRGQKLLATLERGGARIHRTFISGSQPQAGGLVSVQLKSEKVLFF